MLIRIDGSHHRWLGEEHPQLALHLAVNHATGKVLAACFGLDEDSCGYFELFGNLIRGHGIPVALYSNHSAFVPSLHSSQPRLAEGATQFARAVSELGIRQDICRLGTGEETSGKSRRDLPGPPGHRAASGRGKHPYRRQLPAEVISGALQPPVHGHRPPNHRPPIGHSIPNLTLTLTWCFA